MADQTHAVVPQASVQLTNVLTNDLRKTTTNSAGIFSFSGVPTGDYKLDISAKGFNKYIQTDIHLDPGDQRTVREIALSVQSAVNESVTVTAATDQINYDSGEQSSLITANDMKHLAIEGRDATELLKILPGMAIANSDGTVDNTAYDPSQVTRSGALGQYAANGTPLNGQALLTDGADITDPGAYGHALQPINFDQISEMKIQTSSFTADTAHGPIVMNAVSKSGGSDYHGSMYVHARTNQLDTTDWIAKYTSQSKPPDHQVYPGFTLGGPVKLPFTGFNRSKALTFFVGGEDYAQRSVYAYNSASSATLTALVPTPNMKKGIFSSDELKKYLGSEYQTGSTCSKVDPNICAVPTLSLNKSAISNGNISAFIDPLGQAIMSGMPDPNTANVNNYNYVTTNLQDANFWQGKARVDYSISESEKLFASYSVFKGKKGIPQNPWYSERGTMGGINTPGGGLLDQERSHVVSVNWTSILSSTFTNELYGGFGYYHETFQPKSLAATQGNPYEGVFALQDSVMPALQDYGNDGLPLSRLTDGTYGGVYAIKQLRMFGDNATKQLQRHTLRAGLFYQYESNPQSQAFQITNGSISQYYIGSSFVDPVAGTQYTSGNYLANLMEGIAVTYQQMNKQVEPNLYFYNLSGYAQDHYRITRTLTADIGIRLEHLTPWSDAHGTGIPIFDANDYATKAASAIAGGAVEPGMLTHTLDKTIPLSGRPTRGVFVEPRLGFAWDPNGRGQTVVRGGYGIYRAHDSYNDASAGMTTALGQRTYTATKTLFSSLSSYQKLTGCTNTTTCAANDFVADSNLTAYKRGDDEEPRVRTYNLSIDQQFPKKITMEIAYVGNTSDKILNNGSSQNTNAADLNSLPIGSLYTVMPNRGTSVTGAGQTPTMFGTLAASGLTQAQIDSYKKYPLYDHVYVPSHNIYAHYNALQVAVTRQTGQMLFTANYTWSKALGVLFGMNNGYGADPFNYRNDYTYETYDRRHIVNATFSYTEKNYFKERAVGLLANGWEVSGIMGYQAGANLPSTYSMNFGMSGTLTVPLGTTATTNGSVSTCTSTTATTCTISVSNTSLLGTPDVNLQPTLLSNPKATGNHHYFNNDAFGVAAIGTNGAYRMPYLPGPPFFDLDTTLAKTFKISERQSTRFSVSAFNVLNRANRSFSSVLPNTYELTAFNQTSTSLAASDAISAARNQNAIFGYAPLREGRRILKLSVHYDF
ncbi:carboxypeptidase regulatory-like domain-containing protein [Telmatobacter bradus]|uniref:TonB-dependent receptor n=1 Tax=Telmatobacter bradus TaxID=474953 RepID=UPI003B42D05D